MLRLAPGYPLFPYTTLFRSVWIMAIDGTWRRSCVLKGISSVDAELTLEGSIEGLNLKEFFLLLSSTGLAYRRCELVRVDRKSTRLNSSHLGISYAVFCLKKK